MASVYETNGPGAYGTGKAVEHVFGKPANAVFSLIGVNAEIEKQVLEVPKLIIDEKKQKD